MLSRNKSTQVTKVGLAQMLRGGVIMDVVNVEQAKLAEDAGAVAVMALERVPAQIRAEGGVARASDPAMIRAIQQVVSIPVMAKCRIGHFVEAQVLEALEVDFIDESEVLTPADHEFHIDKHAFKVPFVCGCRDLGEALRRIGEGASMLRTALRRLKTLDPEQLMTEAKSLGAPYELLRSVAETGKLPVPNFAAGGIATPADAALCMALGAEAVFVGSGIFLCEQPNKRAKAVVDAVTHWQDFKKLAEVSTGLGAAMRGVERSALLPEQRLSTRGW